MGTNPLSYKAKNPFYLPHVIWSCRTKRLEIRNPNCSTLFGLYLHCVAIILLLLCIMEKGCCLFPAADHISSTITAKCPTKFTVSIRYAKDVVLKFVQSCIPSPQTAVMDSHRVRTLNVPFYVTWSFIGGSEKMFLTHSLYICV